MVRIGNTDNKLYDEYNEYKASGFDSYEDYCEWKYHEYG